MTRQQFMAYERAKMLEFFIKPANDNIVLEAKVIYHKGIFDGLLIGFCVCLAMCVLMMGV